MPPTPNPFALLPLLPGKYTHLHAYAEARLLYGRRMHRVFRCTVNTRSDAAANGEGLRIRPMSARILFCRNTVLPRSRLPMPYRRTAPRSDTSAEFHPLNTVVRSGPRG